MRSERILLKDSVKFRVPNLLWQYVSALDQGAVLVKKCFSWARASAHVIPVLSSLDPGCFTVNHPLARGSASFLMKRNQWSSSPVGIRSGLVRTPVINQSNCPQRRWKGVYRSFASPLGRAVLQCDGHLDSRSPLDRCQHEEEKHFLWDLLSQVTVRRIKQLGLQIYVVTRSLTRSISEVFPPWPTLAINPFRAHSVLQSNWEEREERTWQITER